jgi:beta-phosphoglucomutase
MIQACIFDLDGVIVDTAKYHYLAWKRLADMLNIPFSEEENENLKGVSRVQSLEYILNLGGVQLAADEKSKYAMAKNDWYLEYVSQINEEEILPGVLQLFDDLKSNHIKIALGSASKNAIPILKNIGLLHYFDFISDGNSTDKSKPDPAVFLIAAKGINHEPINCIVFEDALKGVEAAIAGGFRSFGVGDKNTLGIAEYVFPDLKEMTWNKLQNLYNK